MAGVSHGVIPKLEHISLFFVRAVLGQKDKILVSLLCPVQGGRKWWDLAEYFCDLGVIIRGFPSVLEPIPFSEPNSQGFRRV